MRMEFPRIGTVESYSIIFAPVIPSDVIIKDTRQDWARSPRAGEGTAGNALIYERVFHSENEDTMKASPFDREEDQPFHPCSPGPAWPGRKGRDGGVILAQLLSGMGW